MYEPLIVHMKTHLLNTLNEVLQSEQIVTQRAVEKVL